MPKFPLLLILFALSCKQNTAEHSTDCDKTFKSASSQLNEYYLQNDREKLLMALSEIQLTIDSCREYKDRLGNLKLTVLALLKEYEWASAFVDSVDESKFDVPYKKDMYVNTYKALSFEQSGDTIERNKYLQKVVDEIEAYSLNKTFSRDVIYDLYFTKAMFEPKDSLLLEIDQLKSEYPDELEFLEALKETVASFQSNETRKSVETP